MGLGSRLDPSAYRPRESPSPERESACGTRQAEAVADAKKAQTSAG